MNAFNEGLIIGLTIGMIAVLICGYFASLAIKKAYISGFRSNIDAAPRMKRAAMLRSESSYEQER